MIARMKRLTALIYHRDVDQFLAGLQIVGVVHVTEKIDKDASSLARSAETVKRCDHLLSEFARGPRPSSAGAPDIARAEKAVARFEELQSEKAKCESSLVAIAKDRAFFEMFGGFDPSIVRALVNHRLIVKFYKGQEMAIAAINSAEGHIEITTRAGRDICFAVMTRGIFPIVDAEEFRMPDFSPAQLDKSEELTRERLGSIEKETAALVSELAAVQSWRDEQQDRNRFLATQADLAAAAGGKVFTLEGWFPVKNEVLVRKYLAGASAWFEINEPAAEDAPPVKMENGPFARLLEPITRLYMLPNYRELDPTPFFAPAFAFFVGLCLGDVGYGSLILVLSTLAYFKAPKSFRPYSTLGIILGCMVIFCGFLLNSFFGMTIFGGPGIEGALIPTGAKYFAPLSPWTGPHGTEYPAMSLALVIGFLQMLFAMVLQMVNRIRQGSMKTIIIPISWMLQFIGIVIWEAHTNWFDLGVHLLAIGNLKVGPLLLAIPESIGKWTCLGGIGLMFLSGIINGSGKLWARPLMFIWDFYNFATGNMGYMISYIRLFALGLTGGLLGSTFNMLALGFITHDGVTDWLSPMVIFTILLLVAGHALNFALSLVGAFVHPLRLTFVEFYQTLQFAGGGSEYRPFARVNESDK
ncbi:MAG: hypothetical protein MUF22_00915 [Chitinispirillaceae bacterium]|jgi:V/A-type H+-transporting ATPase subunit I|nr:hypothetical protein [Chitinispirillaceae bacterium]